MLSDDGIAARASQDNVSVVMYQLCRMHAHAGWGPPSVAAALAFLGPQKNHGRS